VIELVAAALRSAGLQPTWEDVADTLWLAREIGRHQAPAEPGEITPREVLGEPRPSPVAPERLDQPEIPSTDWEPADTTAPPAAAALHLPPAPGTPVPRGSMPFQTPMVTALPGTHALGLALRPLKRRVPSATTVVFDEEGTAERAAEEGVWTPVLRPAMIRWLELALVIDQSPSMAVWARTVDELRRLAERHGAFRDVRVWLLDTDTADGRPTLYAGTESATSHARPSTPRELVDPGGQRLVLVVSDCVAPAWSSGGVQSLLCLWGQTSPVAIVHMLPQRLWRYTAIETESAELRAPYPGAPNARLSVASSSAASAERELEAMLAAAEDTGAAARPEMTSPLSAGAGAVPVPVIALEPYWVTPWANLVAGAGGRPLPGVIAWAKPRAGEPPDAPEAGLWPSPARLSPNEQVERFRAVVSATAFELAGYLAAVPLTLPIMRLVQQVMLPGSAQVHLAEVLLGGLLERSTPTGSDVHPDQMEYDFADGVREILQDTVLGTDTLRVIHAVGDFVSRRADPAHTFLSLLYAPDEASAANLEERVFATVTARTLRQFGTQYEGLADRLEQTTEGGSSPDATTLPGLEPETATGGEPQDTETAPPADMPESRDSERYTPPRESTDRRDFFVSHAGADRAWAEWVAWQLSDAGYTVELDVWDWAAGRNFITVMSDALGRCDRVVALFSVAYFDRSRYTSSEWSAAALHIAGINEGRLVPLRVEHVPADQMPAIFRPLLSRDLYGVTETEARQILLEAVSGPRRPGSEPLFPGRGLPGPSARGRLGGPLPGTLPRVWNIPARNPGFTGRDALLVAIRERLLAGGTAVVQALHGMGGVGKTQLAVEYAHRFAASYELAWWIDAEQGGLIGDQFAALGAELGVPDARTEPAATRRSVLGELRGERGQWLLVFDNAGNPAEIRAWLPGGNGHVLITSRERSWAEIAAPVEVDVLARAESTAILRDRVSGLGDTDADHIAAELGDLPLAIAQAAGFMAETGTTASEYIRLLRTRAGQLLDQDRPGSYPRSLTATVALIADRLAAEDPAAAKLADLCAFLAPEPIAEELFTRAANALPGDLAERAADPLAWRQTLARLARQSLVRVDRRGLRIHRLTQAILRDRLTPEQAVDTRERSEALLAASDPTDPPNPSTWPGWARLVPHMLAADLDGTDSARLRWLARGLCWYLLARGDVRTGYDLAASLLFRWRERLGEDHEHTLSMAHAFGQALRVMGRYAEARDLDGDTLERRRRILGEDHAVTLTSANSFAVDLGFSGEAKAAHELVQDTLERKRRVLGEYHPSTMISATQLAVSLDDLGEVQAAREIAVDTLDRKRRVLGEDHPETMRSAHVLAATLQAIGELAAARDLSEDTLSRQRRVLGDDHPDTLGSSTQLALGLRVLGELEAARDLGQDTLDRQRRVLGEDHPETMRSAHVLAATLQAMGEELAATRDSDQYTLERMSQVANGDNPRTLDSASRLALDLDGYFERQAARDVSAAPQSPREVRPPIRPPSR
jgi:hypothetical protein